ncbi:MAG: 16S rRNA (cytosine(1402)-N(4))-methyltransferase RsmH [bacterium]|nr:16S rRNA (cytosine(1402)-N(4))-methyltransferase RsmH [bacterium]
MNNFHTPVLLKEVIEYLEVQRGKKYIDATMGGGGHAVEILERGGRVLGIDCDQEAIDYAGEKLKVKSSKLKVNKDLVLAKGNFRDIDKIARLNGFEKVSGILFDLGVSSYQLETSERGFSFQKEGPLDMRMDKDLGVRAADLINALSKKELYELFTKMGEERFARPISNNIIRARRVKKIETTRELASIIEKIGGATSAFAKASADKRVFQALRIAVNDELNNLQEALPKAINLLGDKGRIAVISFHSLEDRIVKDSFKRFQKQGKGTILTKKPVIAGNSEVQSNIRARSAKLRVFSARG